MRVVRIDANTTLFPPDRMPGKIAACAKRGLTAGKVPADLKAKRGCDGIGKAGQRMSTTNKQRTNLVNLADRTPEEREEIARQGGIKSGESKREKKVLSNLYAEIIAELYDVDASNGLSLKTVVQNVLGKGDSATVSMLKVMGEMTEGKKIKMDGSLSVGSMTKEERRQRIKELQEKLNADRS